MGTISLGLLKKDAQKKLDAELEPAPVEEVVEETVEEVDEADGGEDVEFDVDKMTAKEIDQMVVDHGLDVPEDWKKMKVQDKRKYLKDKYDDAGETEVVEDAPVEEAPAPAVKAKGKAKGKAVKNKAVEGEIVSGDVIIDIVHEVENLKEKDAKAYVTTLRETAEKTYFMLGGVLSVIQANSWFTPYSSFKEYVESEHGLNYRRAMYYVQIYNDLVESGVPWDKVKHLGWTKLKEITPVLTKENADEWVAIAEKQTVLQLVETVKNHQNAENPKAIEDQTAKVVTTMTFKVHEDQKATIRAAIDKAKGISDTTVDTVALEFLCLDYLSGGKAQAKPTLKEVLTGMNANEVIAIVAEMFPELGIEFEGEGEAQEED